MIFNYDFSHVSNALKVNFVILFEFGADKVHSFWLPPRNGNERRLWNPVLGWFIINGAHEWRKKSHQRLRRNKGNLLIKWNVNKWWSTKHTHKKSKKLRSTGCARDPDLHRQKYRTPNFLSFFGFAKTITQLITQKKLRHKHKITPRAWCLK